MPDTILVVLVAREATIYVRGSTGLSRPRPALDRWPEARVSASSPPYVAEGLDVADGLDVSITLAGGQRVGVLLLLAPHCGRTCPASRPELLDWPAGEVIHLYYLSISAYRRRHTCLCVYIIAALKCERDM